jgi:acyl-coenzyme A thioesterase PaaI-like protein
LKLNFTDEYQGCFVCGKENPHGLRMDFSYDETQDEMGAACCFPGHMQGYENIVHGGFVSMVLDEVMAKACIQKKTPAVTARIQVRFRKPIYVNEEVIVRGKILSMKGKTIHLTSRCLDTSGEEKASAEAVFIRAG